MNPGAEDIRDIKGLIHIPDYGIVWLLIAIIAALAIAFILYRKLRRSPKPDRSEAIPPPRSAHEVALDELSRLERQVLESPAAVKRFHFELSEITRRYVELRFGLPATDMTSEEIQVALKRVEGLDRGPAAAFIELMKKTDLVKFTDYNPGTEPSLLLARNAREFILETIPRQAVSPPPPNAEGFSAQTPNATEGSST